MKLSLVYSGLVKKKNHIFQPFICNLRMTDLSFSHNIIAKLKKMTTCHMLGYVLYYKIFGLSTSDPQPVDFHLSLKLYCK